MLLDLTKVDACTVTLTYDDPIGLYRTFVTVVLLTRSIVEYAGGVDQDAAAAGQRRGCRVWAGQVCLRGGVELRSPP